MEKINKGKAYIFIFKIGSNYVIRKNIYSTWNNTLKV